MRELGVTNRPDEAKALRDAISLLTLNGSQLSANSSKLPSVTNRNGDPVLSILKPKIKKEAVFLSNDAQKSLKLIIEENQNSNRLAEAGLSPRRKILFWGPPGCGKTVTAELLASELGWGFGVVRLSSLISSFVGETSSNLQKAFNFANANQMILLFDEADAIAKNREDRNDVGELKRVVNSLLQCLDEIVPRKSIIILASNHQHLFDSAIWRRFDDVVEFGLPSAESRLAQLNYLTSGLHLDGSIKEVVKGTAGASFAEIERSVLDVAKFKILSNASSVAAKQIVSELQSLRKKRIAASSLRPQRR